MHFIELMLVITKVQTLFTIKHNILHGSYKDKWLRIDNTQHMLKVIVVLAKSKDRLWKVKPKATHYCAAN